MSDRQSAMRSRGGVPQVRGGSWWRDLWQPFWAIPVACAVAAIVLGTVLIRHQRPDHRGAVHR